MSKPFRPLLASPIDNLDNLKKLPYPMIASPKVDGVRCFVHPEAGPVTRSFKPIPNRYVRELLRPCVGFDGEICLGEPTAKDVFAKTISAVMSQDGEPAINYWVFDYLTNMITPEVPYLTRLQSCQHNVYKVVEASNGETPLRLLIQFLDIRTPEQVLAHEASCVEAGYEGMMLRRMDGRYKFGRSTFKEGILLKLKRFKDDEATIIGFEELQRNQNEQTRNPFGLAQRSSHKSGRVNGGLLGNLIVRHPTFGEFGIGSGFDVSTRDEIWQNQQRYLGKRVTFKYQEVGVVEKPRFPIFKGFRPEE